MGKLFEDNESTPLNPKKNREPVGAGSPRPVANGQSQTRQPQGVAPTGKLFGDDEYTPLNPAPAPPGAPKQGMFSRAAGAIGDAGFAVEEFIGDMTDLTPDVGEETPEQVALRWQKAQLSPALAMTGPQATPGAAQPEAFKQRGFARVAAHPDVEPKLTLEDVQKREAASKEQGVLSGADIINRLTSKGVAITSKIIDYLQAEQKKYELTGIPQAVGANIVERLSGPDAATWGAGAGMKQTPEENYAERGFTQEFEPDVMERLEPVLRGAAIGLQAAVIPGAPVAVPFAAGVEAVLGAVSEIAAPEGERTIKSVVKAALQNPFKTLAFAPDMKSAIVPVEAIYGKPIENPVARLLIEIAPYGVGGLLLTGAKLSKGMVKAGIAGRKAAEKGVAAAGKVAAEATAKLKAKSLMTAAEAADDNLVKAYKANKSVANPDEVLKEAIAHQEARIKETFTDSWHEILGKEKPKTGDGLSVMGSKTQKPKPKTQNLEPDLQGAELDKAVGEKLKKDLADEARFEREYDDALNEVCTEKDPLLVPLDDDEIELIRMVVDGDTSDAAVAFAREQGLRFNKADDMLDEIINFQTDIHGDSWLEVMEQSGRGRSLRASPILRGKGQFLEDAAAEAVIKRVGARGDMDDLRVVADMVDHKNKFGSRGTETAPTKATEYAECFIDNAQLKKITTGMRERTGMSVQEAYETVINDAFQIVRKGDKISKQKLAALNETYAGDMGELRSMLKSGKGKQITIKKEGGKLFATEGPAPKIKPPASTKIHRRSEPAPTKPKPVIDEGLKGWGQRDVASVKKSIVGDFGVTSRADADDLFVFLKDNKAVQSLRDDGLVSRVKDVSDDLLHLWQKKKALAEATGGAKKKAFKRDIAAIKKRLNERVEAIQGVNDIVYMHTGGGGLLDDAFTALQDWNNKVWIKGVDRQLTRATDAFWGKTVGAGAKKIARELKNDTGTLGSIFKKLEYTFGDRLPEEIYTKYRELEAYSSAMAEHLRRRIERMTENLDSGSKIKISKAYRNEIDIKELAPLELKAYRLIEEEITTVQNIGLKSGYLTDEVVKGEKAVHINKRIKGLQGNIKQWEKRQLATKSGEAQDKLQLRINDTLKKIDELEAQRMALPIKPGYLPELYFAKEMDMKKLKKALNKAGILPQWEEFLGHQRSLDKTVNAKMRIQFQRLLKRKDIDPKVREFILGTIEDPFYRTAVASYEIQKNSLLMNFFDEVAASKHVRQTRPVGAKGRVLHGWKRMEGKQFGSLNGKWVTESMYNEFNGAARGQSGIWQLYMKGLTMWKKSKTIYQPATHIRNFLSNYFLADNAGLDMMNPANWKHFSESYEALRHHRGQYWDEVADYGFVKTSFADKDLATYTKNMLEDFGKSQADTIALNGHLKNYEQTLGLLPKGYAKAGKAVRWVDDRVAKIYAAEDQVWRMALYIQRRKLGDEPQEAMKYALYWMLDYGRKSRALTGLTKTVVPFATFMTKSAPVLMHGIARRPWKVAKWAMMYQALEDMSMTGGFNANAIGPETVARALGWSDSEFKKIEDTFPGWLQGGIFGLNKYALVPGATDIKKGRIVAIDTQYNTPFESLMEIGGLVTRGEMPTRLLRMSNPFIDLAWSLNTGRDPYFGKEIYRGSGDISSKGRAGPGDKEYWIGDTEHPGVLGANKQGGYAELVSGRVWV